jgi:peptide/nickel transport system substrate-binding protein
MKTGLRLCAIGLSIVALAGAAAAGAEPVPKRGGTLIFTIPADAPPSFDGHREGTFAMLHATAPFYSVLIRVNPQNPSSTTDFVCDLCTEMPEPTDGGKTYTIKLRDNVKFHDGAKLTSADVKASWDHIVFPPEGNISPRQSWYMMVDKIEAPDPQTVVFRLKFATSAFLPALADPFTFIYQKEKLQKDPRWYEKNVLGSGPFKFVSYETGQSINGARNPDFYREGLPYLDGFTGIYADKQAVRVEAIRSDRAAMEFRGLPPATRDELVAALGDKVTVQESEWNCGSLVTPNARKKPFDDVRVRRALTLAVDRWNGIPALGKIANVRTVAGIVFPTSPLAATKEELQQLAGFWPDIEKSRAEAKRLLKEAGAEGLQFELLNRNIDQPYKYVGTWLIDEWTKIGLKPTMRMMPTGPWTDAMRRGEFQVVLQANCRGVPNPLLDVQPYLPASVFTANYGGFEDQGLVDLYNRMLRETDFPKQRALMREFEKLVIDKEAHEIWVSWWYRIVPHRSYVKGWKISPSHMLNQDLTTVWLDK